MIKTTIKPKINRIFIVILSMCLLPLLLMTSGCKRKSVYQLIDENKFKDAETLCAKQEGDEKHSCYVALGRAYYNLKMYEKAAETFEKIDVYTSVIDAYFAGNMSSKAEEYCARQSGSMKSRCSLYLGKTFYRNRDVTKALIYFKQANDLPLVNHVTSRLRAFRLMELLEKQLTTINSTSYPNIPDLKTDISDSISNLRSYIYIEKYLNLSVTASNGPLPKGDKIYTSVLSKINGEYGLSFVEKGEKLSDAIAMNKISQGLVDDFVYAGKKLDPLVKLLKNLWDMESLRGTFETYSGKVMKIDYEGAYAKAFSHAEMLLTTLEDMKKVEKGSELADYFNDLSVDSQTVDYIAALMGNMKIRMRDIEDHKKRYLEVKADSTSVQYVDSVYNGFFSSMNEVLKDVANSDYQKANDLLVSSYDSAKKELGIRNTVQGY